MLIYKSPGIDTSLFYEAYRCDLSLICVGNEKLMQKLLDRAKEKVGAVKILSYPDDISGTSEYAPGVTNTSLAADKILQRDYKDIIQKCDITVLDKKDYSLEGRKSIMHVEGHELFHMLSAITPGIMKYNKNVVGDFNNTYYNALGYLVKVDNNGDSKRLGMMYCETLTDMLTTIALNTFSPDYNNSVSANTVFRSNYNSWKANVTGYTFFTSLTRLAIAAFSNDPDADFDQMILDKKNIFFSRTRSRNGELLMKNDLLYSYIADPMHIKRQFEKVAGEGEYDRFVIGIDREFDRALNNGTMNKSIIKGYMNVLTSFLNAKLQQYYNDGVFNDDDVLKLISNFNKVWNEVKKDYGIFFTKREIKKLYNGYKSNNKSIKLKY